MLVVQGVHCIQKVGGCCFEKVDVAESVLLIDTRRLHWQDDFKPQQVVRGFNVVFRTT